MTKRSLVLVVTLPVVALVAAFVLNLRKPVPNYPPIMSQWRNRQFYGIGELNAHKEDILQFVRANDGEDLLTPEDEEALLKKIIDFGRLYNGGHFDRYLDFFSAGQLDVSFNVKMVGTFLNALHQLGVDESSYSQSEPISVARAVWDFCEKHQSQRDCYCTDCLSGISLENATMRIHRGNYNDLAPLTRFAEIEGHYGLVDLYPLIGYRYLESSDGRSKPTTAVDLQIYCMTDEGEAFPAYLRLIRHQELWLPVGLAFGYGSISKSFFF